MAQSCFDSAVPHSHARGARIQESGGGGMNRPGSPAGQRGAAGQTEYVCVVAPSHWTCQSLAHLGVFSDKRGLESRVSRRLCPEIGKPEADQPS